MILCLCFCVWEHSTLLHRMTYNKRSIVIKQPKDILNFIYLPLPLGLTALQYVCTSSLCTLTKKNSNPLQQMPASALAGSTTDAAELISIDSEHCSLLGAKRPTNFKVNIFFTVNTLVKEKTTIRLAANIEVAACYEDNVDYNKWL